MFISTETVVAFIWQCLNFSVLSCFVLLCVARRTFEFITVEPKVYSEQKWSQQTSTVVFVFMLHFVFHGDKLSVQHATAGYVQAKVEQSMLQNIWLIVLSVCCNSGFCSSFYIRKNNYSLISLPFKVSNKLMPRNMQNINAKSKIFTFFFTLCFYVIYYHPVFVDAPSSYVTTNKSFQW